LETPIKAAYVFPGQGSQFVGMGRDLYENYKSARAIFDLADRVLGTSLSKTCFEGPEETLRDTINAQPALVVSSLATLAAIREQYDGKGIPQASYVAGHSLGEYTALAVSGVFDFSTAVFLARERGRLMHEATKVRPGTMAAVIGMDEAEVDKICADAGVCIGNVNCPGQLVISGDKDKVAKAVAVVQSGGKGKAIPLSVSAAFHSPLMEPAVEGMLKALSNVNFVEPLIPVVANTTGVAMTTVAEIKTELLGQLTHCVKWQQSVEFMLSKGVNAFYELGAGKVLTGLIRRIDKNVKTFTIGDVNGIKSLAS